MPVLTPHPPHGLPPLTRGRSCPCCGAGTRRVGAPSLLHAMLLVLAGRAASSRACDHCGWYGLAWH